MIRSGKRRSRIAVPSARNSGLDKTSKRTPGWALSESCKKSSAKRHYLLCDSYYGAYGFSCLARYSGFFNNNLVTLCRFCYRTGCCFHETHVCCSAFSDARRFGGSVNTDEDQVGPLDCFLNVRREEELSSSRRSQRNGSKTMEWNVLRRRFCCVAIGSCAISSSKDNLVKAWLIDRQIKRFPGLSSIG